MYRAPDKWSAWSWVSSTQSIVATSQHLAKMCEEGIVDFRRDGQTLWYRVSEPRTELLLSYLQKLYCSEK